MKHPKTIFNPQTVNPFSLKNIIFLNFSSCIIFVYLGVEIKKMFEIKIWLKNFYLDAYLC